MRWTLPILLCAIQLPAATICELQVADGGWVATMTYQAPTTPALITDFQSCAVDGGISLGQCLSIDQTDDYLTVTIQRWWGAVQSITYDARVALPVGVYNLIGQVHINNHGTVPGTLTVRSSSDTPTTETPEPGTMALVLPAILLFCYRRYGLA